MMFYHKLIKAKKYINELRLHTHVYSTADVLLSLAVSCMISYRTRSIAQVHSPRKSPISHHLLLVQWPQ